MATKKELEARIAVLEAEIALLKAQRPITVLPPGPVPAAPLPTGQVWCGAGGFSPAAKGQFTINVSANADLNEMRREVARCSASVAGTR